MKFYLDIEDALFWVAWLHRGYDGSILNLIEYYVVTLCIRLPQTIEPPWLFLFISYVILLFDLGISIALYPMYFFWLCIFFMIINVNTEYRLHENNKQNELLQPSDIQDFGNIETLRLKMHIF